MQTSGDFGTGQCQFFSRTALCETKSVIVRCDPGFCLILSDVNGAIRIEFLRSQAQVLRRDG